MALITCPECNKRISDSTNNCPNCGYKLSPEKIAEIKKSDQKFWKGCSIGCLSIIIIFIIIYAIFSFFPGSLKNNAPTKYMAYEMSQKFVKEELKAPSTANFPSYNESFVEDLGGGQFKVTAYVDAQNSFGAKIRSNFTCVLKSTDGHRWSLVGNVNIF